MLSDTEVDLDWRGDTPEALDGEATLPPGKYHVVITGIKREAERTPCLRFRYQVLAGTNRGIAGASGSERFYLGAEAVKRLKILAHRLGLVKDSDFGTRAGPLNFTAAIGRDLVVEVINEEAASNKEKEKAAEEGRAPKMTTFSKWAYAGFWVPEDPRVADAPKDPAKAAQVRAGMGAAAPRLPAAANHQPQAAPPPRQTVIPTVAQPGAYDDV